MLNTVNFRENPRVKKTSCAGIVDVMRYTLKWHRHAQCKSRLSKCTSIKYYHHSDLIHSLTTFIFELT